MQTDWVRRSRSGFLRQWARGVGVIGAVMLLAACKQPAPPEEPVRAVKVLTVGTSPLQAQAEFAGEVRARTESRLGFRVGGKIIRRPVEIGQTVKPGQLLAQLDPRDYQLSAGAAQAQVDAASTNRDLASSDLKRYQELKAQGFIGAAELERRETALKAAQAQLAQAQAQSSAQANQAAYANLYADVAGVVVAVEAEPGQVVAAGTPVLRLAHDGPRDVVFSVPEDRVGAIVAGATLQVRNWASGNLQTAVVREVGALADPMTRTFSVKAALMGQPAPALGSTAYVRPPALSQAGTQAIRLPTSALRQDGKNTAVWVLDPASMLLRSVAITVAALDTNEVVVSAGLSPGMQVVASGVHVLTAGQKVTLYQARPEVAAATPVTGR